MAIFRWALPLFITNNIVANSTVRATGTTNQNFPKYGAGTRTEDSSVNTFDTETVPMYFAGGLIGRFYRGFRNDNSINSNIISANIIPVQFNRTPTSPPIIPSATRSISQE